MNSDTNENPALIRLPTDKNRGLEGFHEAAWFNLLTGQQPSPITPPPPVPFAYADDPKQAVRDGHHGLESYADVHDRWQVTEDHLTPFLHLLLEHHDNRSDPIDQTQFVTGAEVTADSQCGSDLFVRCATCGRDRVVIEVKGPRAKFNQSTRSGLWQTEVYEAQYAEDHRRCCRCCELQGTPLFVVLYARDRTKAEVAQAEKMDPEALRNWIWLRYSDVLSQPGPRAHTAIARWLMASRSG